MKNARSLLVLAVLVTMGYSFPGASKVSYATSVKSIKQSGINDSVLVGIEGKIHQAFIRSKIEANPDALTELEETLLQISKKDKNPVVEYWLAYAWYYHSIYYLTTQEGKESEKALKHGIQVLENASAMTSEHYALLALMQSFSIQFSPGLDAASISIKVMENANLAVETDNRNLRGYYVLGSNDFYTPEQYGGGKNCEKYLLKAISLEEQEIENPVLPSWGKSQAYEMLIRYYIKNDQTEKARSYFKEAIEAYPDDYMLKQLAGELTLN